MVDLKAKPFFLGEDKIKWVEETIASMTLDEKIGQLFAYLCLDRRPEKIKKVVENYHIGTLRWQGGTKEEVWEQNRLFQEYSRIPLLIAANALDGGNGAISGGTMVATPAACGAAVTSTPAHLVGRVSALESKTVGVNWMFGPCTDVLSNWRNTIVNDRAYGDDPDLVIERASAYMEELHKEGIACCIKHFPGDGSEERDQHLLMGCNDLSVEEWDATFGRVYKAMFERGCEGVMVGHICQRAYQKLLNPALEDKDILPATLSPELLTGLLRERLGFNGVVITDASHMAGLTAAAPRSQQIAGAIAAGCDIVLFMNDPEEDIAYMRKGIESGLITEERLSDALHRILALKAKLGLDNYTYPAKEGLGIVGCSEHHEAAAECADETITLVKDTQCILPVDPNKKKRAMLYYLESQPVSNLDGTDKAKKIVTEELERAGFTVDAHTDYYEMECEKMSPINRFRIMDRPSSEDFKKNYDIVFLFVHIKGYARENVNRIVWSCSHSSELPWYVKEVPTVGVSLNYTNHLIDLPMLKTFINAYAPTRENIRAAIEKITGKSEFKGRANELVWCGRWDTRV